MVSTEASASSHTTSTRGVMIARTARSAMCMTPSIISCSIGLTMPASAPSSRSALISSSVTRDARVSPTPNNRSTALVEPRKSETNGDPSRATTVMGAATRLATPSGLVNANRFGTSSPITSER